MVRHSGLAFITGAFECCGQLWTADTCRVCGRFLRAKVEEGGKPGQGAKANGAVLCGKRPAPFTALAGVKGEKKRARGKGLAAAAGDCAICGGPLPKPEPAAFSQSVICPICKAKRG